MALRSPVEVDLAFQRSCREKPWLNQRERAKDLGISIKVCRRLYREVGNRLVCRARIDALREYAGDDPTKSAWAIAEHFGASPADVRNALRFVDSPLVAQARNHTERRERYLRKVEAQAEGCVEYRPIVDPVRAHVKVDDEKLKTIVQYLKDDPFISVVDVASRLKCDPNLVRYARGILEKEGFDRKLEREIRLGEYIEKNPTASYAEAAEHFGVREGRIKGTPGANQLLANHVVSDKRRNWEQERKEEIEIDQDMYSRVCVRPTDYVVDVRSRGWLGVVLPEEEFKRYLECYTRYRSGKVDTTTRHLKPQGVFNYNGRRK